MNTDHNDQKDRWITEGKMRMIGHGASVLAIPLLFWTIGNQINTAKDMATLTERFLSYDNRMGALSDRITGLQAADTNIYLKIDKQDDRIRANELSISRFLYVPSGDK